MALFAFNLFSQRNCFRIDGVYAVWVLKGPQNRQFDLFFLSFVLRMVLSLQVTAALLLTARFLRTPGGSFRSMWPNTQVCVLCSEQKDVCLNRFVVLYAATFTCQTCKKVFRKVALLRRHKRIHASQKPVLVCPREDCQAYFSTTFNLQHHIRKVHLNLLKYKCPFPDCPRMFAMRVSTGDRRTLHILKCIFLAIV